MAKEVVTTFEAARLCHVSYNTIKNWIKRGLLDAYRTAGGHLRINITELESFCREHGIPMDESKDPMRRKILVVDDEEAVRIALQEALNNYPENLDIYAASDGFEAGTLMEQVRPDLVILDLVMPGMDGFKVCQSIRKSPALKHVKIMVLTGFPSERNMERVSNLGADVCLAKPIDRAALYEAIDGLLSPRRGVRGGRRRTKKGAAGKKKSKR